MLPLAYSFFFQIIRYIPFHSKEGTHSQKLRWDQEHYQGGVGYQPTVGWQYQPTAHATNRTEPTQAGSNHARPSLCPISKTNPFSSSASNDRAPNLLMRSVFSGGTFPFSGRRLSFSVEIALWDLFFAANDGNGHFLQFLKITSTGMFFLETSQCFQLRNPRGVASLRRRLKKVDFVEIEMSFSVKIQF